MMPTHLDILDNFSTRIGKKDNSLLNAIKLAQGSLPLAVVMQEPCNVADTKPYEDMIDGCPALQEVERLAMEASKCQYSLEDLSVFDLNTLHSPRIKDNSKDLESDLLAAHQTFWKMIQAKAPKVILVLTCEARSSKDENVKLLWSSLESAGTQDFISILNDSATTVIRAFHPSVYLRDDYTSSQNWSSEKIRTAKEVLLYCFQMAFCCLSHNSHTMVDKKNPKLMGTWRNYVHGNERVGWTHHLFAKGTLLEFALRRLELSGEK